MFILQVLMVLSRNLSLCLYDPCMWQQWRRSINSDVVLSNLFGFLSPQAARFLHETGVILHYDDPTLHLEHLYFVQPEWLCKIMAQVITVREINPFVNPEGVSVETS